MSVVDVVLNQIEKEQLSFVRNVPMNRVCKMLVDAPVDVITPTDENVIPVAVAGSDRPLASITRVPEYVPGRIHAPISRESSPNCATQGNASKAMIAASLIAQPP